MNQDQTLVVDFGTGTQEERLKQLSLADTKGGRLWSDVEGRVHELHRSQRIAGRAQRLGGAGADDNADCVRLARDRRGEYDDRR